MVASPDPSAPAHDFAPFQYSFIARRDRPFDSVADVKILVRDAKGRVILNTTSDGPFVLARLPTGNYTVEATLGGTTPHQNVSVRPGQPAKVLFVWPAGTDQADSRPSRAQRLGAHVKGSGLTIVISSQT